MEVKNYKLPPLPTKKNPSIQIENQSEKLIMPGPRITSYSRDKQKKRNFYNRPTSQEKSYRRPSSVREKSVDSVKSRQSINSVQSKNSKNSRQSVGQSLDLKRRPSVQYNLKMRVSMPTVSAKSWAIFQMNQAKFIYGKRIFKKRQIASLTKMMNFVTILEILDTYSLDASKIRIKASKEASYMNGTTAELKPGIQLSLEELFYGMMLPSGNDAAYQIAEIGGTLLHMQKNFGYIHKKSVYNVDQFTKYSLQQQYRVKNYLAQMNKVSKRIEMKNSNFANPHGLSNPDNYSCVEDLGKLCRHAMKKQMFRTVVYTQIYTAKCKKPFGFREQEQLGLQALYEDQWINLRWQNTNKMLRQGWSGMKTGVTPNAGPCLAASIKKYISGRDLQFLVILINSKSMQARWAQVKQIVDWAISEEIYF